MILWVISNILLIDGYIIISIWFELYNIAYDYIILSLIFYIGKLIIINLPFIICYIFYIGKLIMP